LPLLIPILKVQELTPEELDPLKDALLAHLRSQNTATRDQVEKNFHVTRGERVPAYAFTLQLLLETREAVPRPFVKPFNEEEARRIPPASGSPAGPGVGLPDLWSFPSEERMDFTLHADSYFLPGTLSVEDCRDCFQQGETGCKPCLGKGVESCPTCMGVGRQPCVYCKGSEKVPCLRCAGEGRLSSGEVGGRSAGCDACAGKGKFPCTHCSGGKLTCPACGGGGKKPCVKCLGQGKTVCASCGGQKKVISGQAFQSAFKPVQARSASLVERGPRDVLDLALQKAVDVGSLSLDMKESLEKQVKEADVPTPLRNALNELVEREKSYLSPNTRVVKRRLEMVEGSVVRISGYCSGQEFAYWMLPGTTQLIAEKDPLTSFGVSAATLAEEARAQGDWKKALSQAREALSYSPDHAVARDIFRAWNGKVIQDVVLAGGSGALIATVVQALWFWQIEKGLHKTGPFLWACGLQLTLGFLGAGVLAAILVRTRNYFSRGTVLALGCAGVFLLSTAAGQWSTRWRSVRAADQAVLDQELNTHFPYGYPEVFFEPDLVFLQNLNDTYKGTRVDLNPLQEALALQRALQARLVAQQVEFNEKVKAILLTGGSGVKKKYQLTKLRNRYSLMGVDVTRADEALQEDFTEKENTVPKKSNPTSRIQIRRGTSSKVTQKTSSRTKPRKSSQETKVRSGESLKNFPPTEPKQPRGKTSSSSSKKAWWE
jgi:hypothetical protein